jgi:hypothetical protein
MAVSTRKEICPKNFPDEICPKNFPDEICPKNFPDEICPKNFPDEICPKNFPDEKEFHRIERPGPPEGREERLVRRLRVRAEVRDHRQVEAGRQLRLVHAGDRVTGVQCYNHVNIFLRKKLSKILAILTR